MRNRWQRVFPGAIPFLLFLLSSRGAAEAQIAFEGEPIHYESQPVHDRVARLISRIEQGTVHLKYEEPHGYLKSLLDLLEIPIESQGLVFSKTSLQLRRINPDRPRAVYFNDDTYVGWVQFGDVLEIASVDARQGAIFYTLAQNPAEKPEILRDKGQCLTCHASSRTQGVPGFLVRSVFPDVNGQPHFGSGTFVNDHGSPFEQRWGGWYVTGTHGAMRHMGNTLAPDRYRDHFDRDKGANVTSLSGRVKTDPYLSPHSDLVALMILEHQTQMHNLITRANYETRSALHSDRIMNAALDRPDHYQSETTRRRIQAAGDKLLKYMLFSQEFALTSPVQGTSGFAERFSRLGPRDRQGRSLRDFDMKRRMFKYPLSYLIYSESFDALPRPVYDYVRRRLMAILNGKEASVDFEHLTPEDRRHILQILKETKPELVKEAEE